MLFAKSGFRRASDYGYQYSGTPGVKPPTIERTIRSYYFKLGDSEEEVVDTCSRYITLVEQFVNDFAKRYP
jgi:hypothetical protein